MRRLKARNISNVDYVICIAMPDVTHIHQAQDPWPISCMNAPCRFMTMSEMMMELRDHPHGGNGVAPKRQPVCLLLGGGMAAGKSTVREIIGRDIFWSKARTSRPCGKRVRGRVVGSGSG